MLELFVLATFVVAVVAIVKANQATRENAALRDELSRIRPKLEGTPNFHRDELRNDPGADAVAGHRQTVPAIPQPIPAADTGDISAAAASQPATEASPDVSPSGEVPTPERKRPIETPVPFVIIQPAATPVIDQPEATPEASTPGATPEASTPEATPETSTPAQHGEPIAASAADAGGDIPAEPIAQGGSGDRERTIATQWTVWIGGVALAMGGLLIVKFSIEAGFFGPGVRLIMGAAFALALAAASSSAGTTSDSM